MISLKEARVKADRLAAQILDYANRTIDDALSDKDLAKWLHGHRFRNIGKNAGNLRVIYQTEGLEEYTYEEYISDPMTSEMMEQSVQIAKNAKAMYGLLVRYPDKENHAKFTLRRNRDEKSWTYHAMAIMPISSRLLLDPQYGDEEVSHENPGIIFFEAATPCINHACDLFYKIIRSNGKLGYLPYVRPQEVSQVLEGSGGGKIEFMDPLTRETQNSEAFMFACITGYFSNQERFRIPEKLLEL